MPPPPLPRQQRRKIKRGLLERGRKCMQKGLPAQLTDDDAPGIALILRDRLSDTANATRAADAAGDAEALLSKTMDPVLRGMEIGCRKGCSYCCSLNVTASAPEVFRIANWLRDNAGGADRHVSIDGIAAAAAQRQNLDEKDIFLDRLPCPMLVSQACGVYEARPLACRALISLSSEACRDALEDNKGEVPVFTPAMDQGEIVRSLLLAAVSSAGLSDRGYELTAAVILAFHQPDAETRWLAGEDVLASVRSGRRLPSARVAQDRIAAMIRALEE